MREIDVTDRNARAPTRALVLGAPKSGKTHFAATAPMPLFISDAAEGGYSTIASMDPKLWWNPHQPPTVWAIEDAFKDLPVMLARLEAAKAENRFPWQTIVIDPISIYADRVLAEMQMRAAMSKQALDGRALYGDLANHLRVMLLRFHALPTNVLWLCHVKEGGLALAGQSADKLPAYMDYTWLCTNNASNFELHTKPYGAFTMLGGRTTVADSKGQRWGLPSPMVPSFKAIAQCMRMNIEPLSPAMPGLPEGARYTWPPEPTTEGNK